MMTLYHNMMIKQIIGGKIMKLYVHVEPVIAYLIISEFDDLQMIIIGKLDDYKNKSSTHLNDESIYI